MILLEIIINSIERRVSIGKTMLEAAGRQFTKASRFTLEQSLNLRRMNKRSYTPVQYGSHQLEGTGLTKSQEITLKSRGGLSEC